MTCSSCGCNYSLAGKGALGSTPAERSSRAQALAAEHGIDLATAYSVLLGIMPLEAAMLTVGSLDAAADSRRIPYDAGFRDAIEKGRLTLQQAVERGDRVSYASGLAQRHGLAMNLAFMVADNEIGVVEALQKKAAPAVRADTSTDPSVPTVRRRPLAGVFALTLLALCGWAYWSGSRERGRDGSGGAATPGIRSGGASTRMDTSSATPRSRAGTKAQESSGQPVASSVEILTDETGALTKVVGQDPMSVLRAFCSHPRNRSTLTPLSVVPAAVRGSAEQVGLVRDDEHGSQMKAVVITRDPRSRRWQMGNGQASIRFLESIPLSQPAIAAGL